MRSVFFTAFLLSVILISNSASAKNKNLVKANFYYSHGKYHDAIPYFEKVVDDENNPELYGHLGDCYRFTNNVARAAEWYAKAVSLQGCKDEYILQYGKLLMEMMKYDSAKKILTDYQTRNLSDKRVANLIASCTSAPQKLLEKPKGTVNFLNLNTNGSEYAPTIWKNNLVFTADVAIDSDKTINKIVEYTFNRIYYVRCDNNGNTAKQFYRVNIKGKSKKEHIGPATFTQDGKKMYYTVTKSDDKNSGGQPSSKVIVTMPLEIMIASGYDSTTGEFVKTEPFKYNSKKYSVAHPTVSPDGNVLMFTSDMQGGQGGSDIYICRKNEDGEWSEPVNAGTEINTEGEEIFPYLADNETLFFSSDGHEGLGGLDIYMSKWDPQTNSFSKPVNLGVPINSSYDDNSLALRPDGGSTYFSSNRPSLKAGDNLYFFDRAHSYLHIKLFDKVTNNPLNVAKIVLESAGGGKSYVNVDKFGEFIAPVYTGVQYKVVIGKSGYTSKSFNLNTTGLVENDTLVQTVTLSSLNVIEEVPEVPLVKNEPPVKVRDSSYYKKPSYLILTVTDSISKKPLKSAIVNLQSEKDTRGIETNPKGKVLTQLLPEVQYSMLITKIGYHSKLITLKTIFAREEPDTFVENIALSIDKLAKHKKNKHKEVATTDAGSDDDAGVAQKERGKKKHKHAGKGDEVSEETVAVGSNSGKDLVKGRQYNLDGYYAEYNKAEIVESRKYILDSLIQMLVENPKMRIRILGHADCRGSAEYNMKLSTERALVVGKYLISKGIDPKRLEHKGLGFSKPVVKCPVCNECNEEQHQQNRGFDYVVLHK